MHKKYNSNTTDISSTIDTEIYNETISYAEKRVINIGWSGSHSTSKYLCLLEDVFKELNRKFNIELIVSTTLVWKLLFYKMKLSFQIFC